MNNRMRCNNVSRSADKFPTISGAVKSWKYRKGLVLSTNRTFFQSFFNFTRKLGKEKREGKWDTRENYSFLD